MRLSITFACLVLLGSNFLVTKAAPFSKNLFSGKRAFNEDEDDGNELYDILDSEFLFNPDYESILFDHDSLVLNWWLQNTYYSSRYNHTALNYIPVLELEGRRFEFDHNWPSISRSRAKMEAITCVVYRDFVKSLLSLQNYRGFVETCMDHQLIDFNRPIVEIMPGYQKPRCYSYLHFIIQVGDIDLVRKLISVYPLEKIDYHLDGEFTPLQLAVSSRKLDIVSELLAHGADPNIVSGNYGTAAMIAFNEAFPEIIKFLARSGRCDPRIRFQGKTLYSMFFASRMMEFLELIANWPGTDDNDIFHLLIITYARNPNFHLKCLKTLLPFRRFENVFMKELRTYVRTGDLRAFNEIVRYGYNVPQVYKVGPIISESLLHMVIIHDNTHMIPAILKTVDCEDVLDVKGMTPMMAAISRGNAMAVHLLLKHGKKSNVAEALKKASLTSYVEIIKILVHSLPSINGIYLKEMSLPVYVAKYGSVWNLNALLSQLNYDPYMVDPSGHSLATLESPCRVIREAISNYIKAFENKKAAEMSEA